MNQNKPVHPIILIMLFMTAVIMGIYTYVNFSANNLALGYLSLFLCTMLFTMTITGWHKNRKNDHS